MENTYKKGEYLEVETLNDGIFGGYFLSQNNEKTRLSLFNVRNLPEGEVSELLHLSTVDIKYVQRDANPSKEIEDTASEIEDLKFDKDESQATDSVNNKYIFINQGDNRFHEAMVDLNKHSLIGLGTEGAELGRKCKLSILTLSTPTQIYIFDVQAFQDNAFESGIKNLLECTDITKIVHNSRKISDCLFHKHGIKINKVFDIQAADIIIQKQKIGYFPLEVRTLQDCLNTYLDLKDHAITEKIDIVELAKRPVLLKFKEIAASNILHHHRLYAAINKQIMAPFAKGFEFYLDCERACSDSEAWYLFSQDKKLPKMYQEAIQNY